MFLTRIIFVVIAETLLVASDLEISGPDDLHQQYYNIFKTGNRNAASHLWASYILQHASMLPAANFTNAFKGFCPVSGSPIPDAPRTRYKVSLPIVGGDLITGIMHHCCWPCICDGHDFLRVDTRTVATLDGPRTYNMLVMGDPCKDEEKLKEPYIDPFNGLSTALAYTAPELSCHSNQTLQGATYSDHGYPIVGLFFTDAAYVSNVAAKMEITDENDATFGFGATCQQRAQNGYSSGMGLIFRLVAGVNPIQGSSSLTPSAGSSQQIQPSSSSQPEQSTSSSSEAEPEPEPSNHNHHHSSGAEPEPEPEPSNQKESIESQNNVMSAEASRQSGLALPGHLLVTLCMSSMMSLW
jgi:hypothetical protein